MLDDERRMPQTQEQIRIQHYGPRGPTAFVLHGGPGAPGSAASLAQALADPIHVIEPWQRWSSDVPLSVERHVEDLASLLKEHSSFARPALVGASWGAMLALATAARYPQHVGAVLLIGCGTFDHRARAKLRATLASRTTPELRSALDAIERGCSDPSERALRSNLVAESLYTVERAEDVLEPQVDFDLQGHLESWNDMIQLQSLGIYPAAFSAIDCPVQMLHGQNDPHPGAMIRDGLQPHLPQLRYEEFEKCGHSPWVEEHARGDFLATARIWLETVLTARAGSASSNENKALQPPAADGGG